MSNVIRVIENGLYELGIFNTYFYMFLVAGFMEDKISKDLKRESWDRYFLDVAKLISTRSTCLRRHVGSVITIDHIIVASGYNGAPAKYPHCIECNREKLNIPSGEQLDKCVACHAEENAIIQAAKFGISINNATLYCTNQPCIFCAKMIINSGITKVIFEKEYNDTFPIDMMRQCGVHVIKYCDKENCSCK